MQTTQELEHTPLLVENMPVPRYSTANRARDVALNGHGDIVSKIMMCEIFKFRFSFTLLIDLCVRMLGP